MVHVDSLQFNRAPSLFPPTRLRFLRIPSGVFFFTPSQFLASPCFLVTSPRLILFHVRVRWVSDTVFSFLRMKNLRPPHPVMPLVEPVKNARGNVPSLASFKDVPFFRTTKH